MPASGNGEALISKTNGNESARRLLNEALDSLSSYFDGRPRIVGAVATKDDDEIQGILTGDRGGTPVRGLAFVQVSGAQSVTTILYDRPERFASSFAELVRLAQQSLPAPAVRPVALQRQRLPDGSGEISLPEGWTLNVNNGMVSAGGPQGNVDLGLSAQVYTPEAAAQYPVRPPLVASYGDPGRAFQEILAQTGVTPTTESIRIIERSGLPWWDRGVGEILHVEGIMEGQQRESVAMVLISPTGFGTWSFYCSAVGSDPAAFSKNLPVLLKIWASWKTDDRVFQERLMRAAESLQACARIIREVNATRQDAMERSSLAWDNYIRGSWPIEDQQTRTRYTAEQDVNAVVRGLNESEGYDRYRVVPYAELNR